MKPTKTVDECLKSLPEPIAKRLREDSGDAWLSARSLLASFWVPNPHSKEPGELANVLIWPLDTAKAIAASWYLHKGGTNPKSHREFLESCNISDSKYHGAIA